MTQPAAHIEPTEGLYVTDIELIRRMGWGERRGRDYVRRLDRGVRGLRTYPQKDPLFGNRRFWPEVLQWHMDYHRVRTGAEASVAPSSPWQENFNEPAPKASEPKRARPQLASA